jgi:hypothetical protein
MLQHVHFTCRQLNIAFVVAMRLILLVAEGALGERSLHPGIEPREICRERLTKLRPLDFPARQGPVRDLEKFSDLALGSAETTKLHGLDEILVFPLTRPSAGHLLVLLSFQTRSPDVLDSPDLFGSLRRAIPPLRIARIWHDSMGAFFLALIRRGNCLLWNVLPKPSDSGILRHLTSRGSLKLL